VVASVSLAGGMQSSVWGNWPLVSMSTISYGDLG